MSLIMETKPQSSGSLDRVDPILAAFDGIERVSREDPIRYQLPLRKAGLSRFAELGFPTLSQEDWRYTNVAEITQLPFQLAQPASPSLVLPLLEQHPLAGIDGDRLVFVDGHYLPEASSVGPLPAGVRIHSLKAALQDLDCAASRRLAGSRSVEEDAFAALNTAFFTDGAYLEVPAGVVLERPLHILHIKVEGMAFPRSLVVAGANSQFTVVESFWGLSSATGLTSSVTEVYADSGANVEHVKFQDESPKSYHIASLLARMAENAHVLSHSFALGGRIARQSIRTALEGPGVECVLNGLFLGRASQLLDHHMVVDHAKPHCASHEYFNGILTDRSRGVFHGRILVRKDAQKTDAKQTNKNLVLSDDAEVDTKPQLEIYADDVKCTHGATVGQLNSESVFYLRSRGIGLDRARRMLIHAFAGEITERVCHAALREALDRLIWDRLEVIARLGDS
jgi:Fe-S cluster assembly protein SufD